MDIDQKSITLAGDATVLDSVNTIVLGNVDLGATDNNAVLSFDIKIRTMRRTYPVKNPRP